ncbi:MAG: tetratricopeptide repeat protein [Candidatus Omnitrophica bacterium]|nr:tetratricopeptide repeat protein [Candidatus Omnitrophota bacterium]
MNKPISFKSWSKTAGILFLGFLLTGGDLKPGELAFSEAVAYRAEGRWYQKNRNFQNAMNSYRKAILVDPSYADAYNDLGVVLESFGDLKESERAYLSALKLKPQLPGAHSNLALLYERMGRVGDAAEHWTARVRSGPPGDPWVTKAREKLREYQFPVPESPKQAAQRETQPSSSEAKTLAKQLMQEKGKAQALAAKEQVKAAAKQKAEETERKKQQEQEAKAAALEAHWAEQTRQKEEARQKVEEARQQKKEGSKWKAPASKGHSEAEQFARELAQEKSLVQKPVQIDSESKAMAEKLTREKEKNQHQTIQELLQRAVTAMRQGRYEEAITNYRQVLILNPNHVEANQGLKRAQTALVKSK